MEIKHSFHIRNWIVSLVCGSLIGIAFLIPYLWFLPFFGVALLILIITQTNSPIQSFLYGYYSGLTANLFLLAILFWPTIPLDWFGLHGIVAQVAGAGGSWILLSVVLATAQGLFSLSVYFFKTGTWFDTLLFPSLWVLCEVVSTLVFFVLSLGFNF